MRTFSSLTIFWRSASSIICQRPIPRRPLEPAIGSRSLLVCPAGRLRRTCGATARHSGLFAELRAGSAARQAEIIDRLFAGRPEVRRSRPSPARRRSCAGLGPGARVAGANGLNRRMAFRTSLPHRSNCWNGLKPNHLHVLAHLLWLRANCVIDISRCTAPRPAGCRRRTDDGAERDRHSVGRPCSLPRDVRSTPDG